MKLEDFLAKWLGKGGAERANKDSFLRDLCDVLGVEGPPPASEDRASDAYGFEHPVSFVDVDGTRRTGFIDLYKEGCFILEAKQGAARGASRMGTAWRDSDRWVREMNAARGQALSYATTFQKPPPFLIVVDIGHCFDLYASFEGNQSYAPFPAPKQARISLADLGQHLELFRAIFTDPLSLDPARHAAKVTRKVAEALAELAKQLEKKGHTGEPMARFLMRCLFTMFAEDVGLLPDHLFTRALEDHWLPHPERFAGGVSALWRAMNTGEHYGPLGKLLEFNGGLFRDAGAITLEAEQLQLLHQAAKSDWSQVDPAIFGTLLERALDPKERHKLGAHYTPRAYVERLVKPTIEEPLREAWNEVQIDVRRLLKAADDAKSERAARTKRAEAIAELHAFQKRLATLRVLDPACGTGNFLYVALDVLKRIEAEVLVQLEELGETQQGMELEGLRVTPQQFLGIEIKPWAKEIAELVLWIGYLQWHFRSYGKASMPEPVLRDYKNIECRDAVLAWDGEPVPRLDESGKPVTRWDGESTKTDPVTGKQVPDESKQVAIYDYVNPRPAEWPQADFIVGNPPFLGTKRMRAALGDGYVEALRAAYEGRVEDNADYVMFWWFNAAQILLDPKRGLSKFGFITTNSITQSFNRRVLERALAAGVNLVWAIPNHPWVDSESGAAVRIAMTVASREATQRARLAVVTDESDPQDGDATMVTLATTEGPIGPDLRQGASLLDCVPLTSNLGVSGMGVALHGAGFILTPEEAITARKFGDTVIRPYVGGRDVQQARRERYLIDFSGMSEAQARAANPHAFQRVVDRVLPERRVNRRDSIRTLWWRFGWERPLVREALRGLKRYIGTTETAKHRTFSFVDGETLADHMIIVFAIDDASVLGTLSSRVHVVWSLAAGGRLGVGNDPRYNKKRCFDPFPFPAATEPQKARIRDLGERLDAHRKRQLELHPKLTITAMYNVLEKLRSGEALSDKERVIHEQGLVSLLKQIHDELDDAVFEAYGWPRDLGDEQILERLVALNAERAKEEAAGFVRWLRPEYQAKATQTSAPLGGDEAEAGDDAGAEAEGEAPARPSAPPPSKGAKAPQLAWPTKTSERMAAIRHALGEGLALSAGELAKRLKGAKLDQLEDLLDGMAAFGGLVRIPGEEPRFKAAG